MATTADVADNADAAPTVNDYINLANYVYTSGQDPAAFPAIDYAPLLHNGKPVEHIAIDGFYGQAFISTGTANPNVIVAFEGTNLEHSPPSALFTAAQVLDDKDIFEGKNPLAYTTALKFTRIAIKDAEAQNISPANVYLAGHSLGGAEAEYVSAKLDLPGTTFGAPGIPSSDFQPGVTPRLTNYIDYGDPVGNYSADNPALGSIARSQSPLISHYGTEQYVGPLSDSGLLYDIESTYSEGDLGKIAAAGYFAYGFSHYHVLTHYAADLANDGVQLSGVDGSTGSDTSFFSSLFPSVGAPQSVVAAQLAAAAVCFASGTHIETERGRVAVEMLSTEDLVVTASGQRRPIRWLGHGAVDCRRHPRPQDVLPVRIAAHAFGPNTPARDLLVSPAHAICVDVEGEILVPASALINGTSVAQIEVDAVTYWHVELESHDILLAENLPAESYLEMGNRGFFVEAEALVLHGVPDAPRRSHADFCRPFVASGPVVDAVRERLRRRAPQVKLAA